MAQTGKGSPGGPKQGTKPGPGLPSKNPGKESGKGRENLPPKPKKS